MEKVQCPGCGSAEVKQISFTEYKCEYCGTTFTSTQAPSGFVDVVLVQAGKNQMQVIQAIRMVSDMGLAEAKRAVDHPPMVINQNVTVAEGERIKAALEKAGGIAKLKPA